MKLPRDFISSGVRYMSIVGEKRKLAERSRGVNVRRTNNGNRDGEVGVADTTDPVTSLLQRRAFFLFKASLLMDCLPSMSESKTEGR